MPVYVGDYIDETTFPANTERNKNVPSTSLRRQDVAAMSKQRCFDVLCLLGYGVFSLSIYVLIHVKE